MFLNEDAVRERVLVIVIHHPDTALEDDGATVKAFIHEVYGAPGQFYPVHERLTLGMEAGETG